MNYFIQQPSDLFFPEQGVYQEEELSVWHLFRALPSGCVRIDDFFDPIFTFRWRKGLSLEAFLSARSLSR